MCTGSISCGTAWALGLGARMHWYPRKGAFRVGVAETTYWDDDGSLTPNLAYYSIAMGYRPRATGVASVAIGGYNNATGDYALALGSRSEATASYAVAIGSEALATGIYSFALGNRVSTNGYDGAMILGDDSYDIPILKAYSSNNNQITMRFAGDSYYDDNNDMGDGGAGSHKAYRFFTSYPGGTNGVYMVHDGNGWNAYSSRQLKENFTDLDFEAILQKINNMYVSEWNYKGVPDQKYIGPIAEEFWDAFRLNGTDKMGINSISIDGVNMAAVKGLILRTDEMKSKLGQIENQEALIREQNAKIDELKQEIENLKSTIARIASASNR